MLLLPLIMTSEALHVSFLGNSFTYFNDLPSCVVSACRAAGVGATAAEHTVGGEALSGHLENERARALLAAPADALVVQDNSVNPGRASEERFEDSLRALDDIAERAAHVEHVVVRAEPKKKGSRRRGTAAPRPVHGRLSEDRPASGRAGRRLRLVGPPRRLGLRGDAGRLSRLSDDAAAHGRGM